MAASNRKKAPARWAVLIGSGLATAGFLYAIVSGPQPSQASVPPTTVVQTAPAPRTLAGDGPSRLARPSSPQSGFAPSPFAPPRLRTRGS